MPQSSTATSLSRRSFLKLGVAGTVALSSVSVVAGLSGCGRREQAAAQGFQFLRDADLALFRALMPVILGEALPADAGARQAALAQTLQRVDTSCYVLDPSARRELYQLFDLLNLRPTRWLTTGVAAPWERATPEAIERFLARWRDSSIAAFNAGFRVLIRLVAASYYSQSQTWPLSGYPGPLDWVYKSVNA